MWNVAVRDFCRCKVRLIVDIINVMLKYGLYGIRNYN